ncbi:MAG TPA: ferrochelatase [Acidimicrobiales bacterium]
MAGAVTRSGLVVMAYGTPGSPDEIEAYYTHIRRGRPPSPEQLAELVSRYEAIGGTSPLAARTRDQVAAIRAALDAAAPGEWVVELGTKHAPPFIEDGVQALAKAGVARAVGLVLAPHYSRGSVGEYHARARAAADEAGLAYVGIDSWHDSEPWIAAQAERVRAARAGLPPATEVLFTAHSLPERVLEGDRYVDELEASARAIAARADLGPGPGGGTRGGSGGAAGPADGAGWRLAWQSAGRTPEPWRGPDVAEVIRELGAGGAVAGVLVCPQGFTSDHLEVLYDLDVDARRVAEEAGLAFARTASINDDPAVMADLAARVRRAAGPS